MSNQNDKNAAIAVVFWLIIILICSACYGQGSPVIPYMTQYIRTLLDDADAKTARDTLELGKADSVIFEDLTLDPCDTLSVVGSITDTSFTSCGWLYVVDDYCYMTSYTDDTLGIIDVSNPASPVLISSLQDHTYLDGAEAVIVIGNYAYVVAMGPDDASYGDCLTVIDVSDKENPTRVGYAQDHTYLSGAEGLDIAGKYAYVMAYNNGYFTTVDISDPTNPSIVGQYDASSHLGQGVHPVVRGNYAYVSGRSGDKFVILDISDPTNVSYVTNLTDGTYIDKPSGLDVRGRYAYLCSSGEAAGAHGYLVVIDVHDTSSPSITDTLDFGADTNPYNCIVVGNYAYVTLLGSDSIAVVNISNPADISLVTTLTDATYLNGADDIMAYGRYAYIAANNAERMTVVNIGGLETPAISAGTVECQYFNCSDDIIGGKSLYVHDSVVAGQAGILSGGQISSYGYFDAMGSEIYGLNLSDGTWSSGAINLDADPNIYADDTEIFHSNSSQESMFLGIGTRNGDVGDNNTFLGYYAGYNNEYGGGGTSNGDRNVYVGQRSGEGATVATTNTGSENIGVGAETLRYNTSGYENTAIGDEALKSNTTGHGNTAFGNDALEYNTTGVSNVAIGTDAMYNNVDGSYNVSVGYQSLYTSSSSSYDIGMGYQAGYSDSGQYNVFMGYQAGYYNDTTGSGNEGDQNLYIGRFCGYGSSGSNKGYRNVGIGNVALYANTTGYDNVALGNESMRLNTSGRFNLAFGAYSLYTNTTGLFNAAVGYNSIYSNSTGSKNIAVGTSALYSITGGNNVGIGVNAGQTATGNRNIFIGDSSGWYQAGVNDRLLIDNRQRTNAAAELDEAIIFATMDASPVNQKLITNATSSNTLRTETLGVGATTFAIESNVMTITGDAGGNTVATITGANSGTLLTLIFVDGNVQITDDDTHGADSVDLSAAFTSADDTTLQLVYDGTSWYETSRSTN